jgi:hypothetical protein
LFCKKVLFAALLFGLAAAMPTALPAQAIATSYATNGGTAFSESTLYGPGRAESHAAANCGTAIARQECQGLYGGCADGLSTANTVGGYAEANGFNQACGPGSVSCGRVAASSYCGRAMANGTGMAGPYGTSEDVSTALSQWGNARSDAYSQAAYGSAYSDSLAHSFGPLTWTRTYSHGYGAYPGSANATSIGVGIGVNYPVFPSAEASARADFGGQAAARAVDYRYGN